MAQKDSEFTAAGALSGADIVAILQDVLGTPLNRRTTLDAMATYIGHAATGAAIVTVDNTTTYNVDAADVGLYRRLTAATAKTINVAADATEALPANYQQHFDNDGAGNATFVPAVGVTIKAPYGGTLVLPPNGVVTLKRLTTNVFRLLGNTVPA